MAGLCQNSEGLCDGGESKEYVEAARVIGLSRKVIMVRHILPNTMTSVLVISTIQVANAIMSEAALSFWD